MNTLATGFEKALAALEGTIIVSCQAGPESPLNEPRIIAALAASAERGGASGFRVDGPENVAAVRAMSTLPIFGINKVDIDDFDVRITPRLRDALAVIDAGADVVALDGTARPRPDGETLVDVIAGVHDRGVAVMADIATIEDARYALDAGADVVATTLAGYTADTASLDRRGPALDLVEALGAAGIPFIVEGRIWTIEHLRACLDAGAFAVIIGSAITVPEFITKRFVAAIERSEA